MLKDNKEKVHDLVTIQIVEKEGGLMSYQAINLNQVVDYGYLLEGIAVVLDSLLQHAKENKIPIPEKLKKFEYKTR